MSDTPEPAAAPAAKVHKLYPKDWLEIIGLAKDGTPVEKIAKLYKVRRSTIYRGLAKRNIKIGAYVASAQEIVEDQTRKELIEKIRATKDNGYALTKVVEQRMARLLGEADAAKKPYSTIADDLKALDTALKIVERGLANKWKILGLVRDNEHADRALPELPVRELTENEVAAIRDKQLMEDGLSDEELAALDGLDADADLDDDIEEEGDDAP